MRRKRFPTVLWALIGAAALTGAAHDGVLKADAGSRSAGSRPEAPAWRWVKEDGKSVALAGAAGDLWRFKYEAGLDKPYFHPLRTIDGAILTAERPADHIWHYGLWFSWKYINGVNYWEVDPKTGRPAGRTSWSGVRVETRDDFSARIVMDVDYRPAGTPDPVLTEKRTIEVSAPDAEGVYAVDWTGVFTAKATAFLDRTPLPGEPGGKIYGGYAGLSLRLAKATAERRPTTSDGPIAEFKDDRYRGRHTALDYSGLIDGREAGAAILDHPKNPRVPSPWYVIRSAEMSFFTPAVLCFAPLPLRAGGTMTLRYRVLIHPGRWDAARLRRESGRFAAKRLP